MSHLINVTGINYSIRPISQSDVHALHELYHQPEIAPWLPSSFTSGKILGTAWILKELMKSLQHPRGIFLAITDEDDLLIGACALEAHVPDHARYEVAFELHPKFHRRGIMTAALTYLINIAFSEFNANRLDAFTLTNNIPSQSILITLGFEKEGVLKQFRMFRNQYCDVVVLGLTHDQWQSR